MFRNCTGNSCRGMAPVKGLGQAEGPTTKDVPSCRGPGGHTWSSSTVGAATWKERCVYAVAGWML